MGINLIGGVPLLSFWEIVLTPFGWLFELCYKIVPVFAVAMFLYALIFKVVLFPLDIKRQRSQAKMVRIQPKLNEVQKKYANDRVKMQEEMQRLQNEEGYSPFGGCLPSLLPLPIFIAIWQVISKPLTYLCGITTEVRNAAMALVELTERSSYYELALYRAVVNSDPRLAGAEIMQFVDKIRGLDMTLFGVDLTMTVNTEGRPWYIWIFPILMVGMSILSSVIIGQISKKNNEGIAGAAAAANPLMTVGMPLITGLICYGFPAGVQLYWIANSILMILVNLVLNKFWPMKKLAAEYDAQIAKLRAEGKPVGKTSKFRQKLAEKQADNEEATRQYYEMKDMSNARKKEMERRMIAKARERELEAASQEQGHVVDEELREKLRASAEKAAAKKKEAVTPSEEGNSGVNWEARRKLIEAQKKKKK